LNCFKKSAPTIGKATAANKNFHVNVRPPTWSVLTHSPQQATGFLSAVTRLGPVAGAEEW